MVAEALQVAVAFDWVAAASMEVFAMPAVVAMVVVAKGPVAMEVVAKLAVVAMVLVAPMLVGLVVVAIVSMLVVAVAMEVFVAMVTVYKRNCIKLRRYIDGDTSHL